MTTARLSSIFVGTLPSTLVTNSRTHNCTEEAVGGLLEVLNLVRRSSWTKAKGNGPLSHGIELFLGLDFSEATFTTGYASHLNTMGLKNRPRKAVHDDRSSEFSIQNSIVFAS